MICCPNFVYDNNCYDKCPKRMKDINGDNICEPFSCYPNYYNYEQEYCIDYVPVGYYVNDTELHTIDKCYKTCRTCSDQVPTKAKHHCLTCNQTYYPYFYFNNCFEKCENGYYIFINIIIFYLLF